MNRRMFRVRARCSDLPWSSAARWFYRLLMVSCVLVSPPTAAQWAVRVAAGAESDSNPRREVESDAPSDAAARAFVMTQGRWSSSASGWGAWAANASVAAGARALGREQSEDSLNSDVRATLMQTHSAAWLPYLEVGFRDRTERESFRDYRRLTGALGMLARLAAADLRADVGWSTLVFKPDRDLDWRGLAASVSADWLVSRTLSVRFQGGVQQRQLSSAAVVLGPSGVTQSSAGSRVDTTWTAGAGLDWDTTAALLGARWQVARNASKSYGRGFVRHSLLMEATTQPVGQLLVRGGANLQWSRFDDLVLVDETFEIDDENRTQAMLVLQHPLGRSGLMLEQRTTLYADVFRGDESAAFRRWLVYGGLAWEWRSRGRGE